jgi:predicted TIM-barrel fold metal-dependent hydrolase
VIVDAHLHVYGRTWHPEWLWEHLRRLPDFGNNMPEGEFENRFIPEFCDPTGEHLIEEMDRSGTDRSMILCIDWNLAVPGAEAKLSIRDQNRAHAEICLRYPERLSFGVGVDPRRKDAIEILEEGIELGARVVKLYPPAGYYPNDRELYPFYERAIDLGVPLLAHSGPVRIGRALRMKYSHPTFWNDVTVDLPELELILAHCSSHWWRESLGVTSAFENLYCDMSWFADVVHPEAFGRDGVFEHERALDVPPTRKVFWRHLREILNLMPGRVMFGSDYTGLRGVQEAHVKLYGSWMDAAEEADVHFSEQEMEDFFWRTAAKVYRWDDELAREALHG